MIASASALSARRFRRVSAIIVSSRARLRSEEIIRAGRVSYGSNARWIWAKGCCGSTTSVPVTLIDSCSRKSRQTAGSRSIHQSRRFVCGGAIDLNAPFPTTHQSSPQNRFAHSSAVFGRSEMTYWTFRLRLSLCSTQMPASFACAITADTAAACCLSAVAFV
jgi:hypothetical protein